MMGKREEARARSTVYQLLSRAFLKEPTIPFLESVADQDALRVLSKMGDKWIAHLPEMDLGTLVEELGAEYARLFVGPGFHAHPYESAYVDGSGHLGVDAGLYGEAAIAVEEFYRQAQIAFSPSFRGLPDHVGVELECMSHLTAREARCWGREDLEAAISSLRLQQTFLCQHLILWLPRFSRLVRRFEAHSFYRTLASAASRFVRVDLQTVDALLSEYLARDEELGEPHETTTSMYLDHR